MTPTLPQQERHPELVLEALHELAHRGLLDDGAGFLLRHMLLFFVPAATGIVDHRELLGAGGVFRSPLLLVPAALAGALVALRVPYGAYMGGGRWLADLLGPTVVALAVPLHRDRALLRRHAAELGAGVAVGCAVAVASSYGLARALGLAEATARSMAPRSITTPLAMSAAEAG